MMKLIKLTKSRKNIPTVSALPPSEVISAISVEKVIITTYGGALPEGYKPHFHFKTLNTEFDPFGVAIWINGEQLVTREPPAPPFGTEFLLAFMADAKTRSAIVGDSEEVFHSDCLKYGEARARRNFQVGLIGAAIRMFFSRLLEIGAIGALWKYISK